MFNYIASAALFAAAVSADSLSLSDYNPEGLVKFDDTHMTEIDLSPDFVDHFEGHTLNLGSNKYFKFAIESQMGSTGYQWFLAENDESQGNAYDLIDHYYVHGSDAPGASGTQYFVIKSLDETTGHGVEQFKLYLLRSSDMGAVIGAKTVALDLEFAMN